jgi:hypothetical protein
MDGVAGFEPTISRPKLEALPTWRYSKNLNTDYIKDNE